MRSTQDEDLMADEFGGFDEFAPEQERGCGCGCSSKAACTCSGVGTDAEADDETLDAEIFDEEMEALATRLAPLLRRLAPLAAETISPDWEMDEEDGEDFEDDAAGADAGGAEPADEGTKTPADGDDVGAEPAGEPAGEPALADEDEAMTQQLAGDSATVQDDRAAECLAGGVVVQIFSPTPPEVKQMLPTVLYRTSRLVRLLRRHPRTRPFLRLLPSIQRATAAALARRARRGRRITRRFAARALRRQTARMFRSPRRVASALRRNWARRRRLNLGAIARSERSA